MKREKCKRNVIFTGFGKEYFWLASINLIFLGKFRIFSGFAYFLAQKKILNCSIMQANL